MDYNFYTFITSEISQENTILKKNSLKNLPLAMSKGILQCSIQKLKKNFKEILYNRPVIQNSDTKTISNRSSPISLSNIQKFTLWIYHLFLPSLLQPLKGIWKELIIQMSLQNYYHDSDHPVKLTLSLRYLKFLYYHLYYLLTLCCLKRYPTMRQLRFELMKIKYILKFSFEVTLVMFQGISSHM